MTFIFTPHSQHIHKCNCETETLNSQKVQSFFNHIHKLHTTGARPLLNLIRWPTTYDRIVLAYKEWLGLLGYSKSTVNSMPKRVQEFFNYLESEQIQSIQAIEQNHIKAFYIQQKTRVSLNNGKLLSNSTINGYLRNLRLLAQYLQETEQGFLEVDIPNEPKTTAEKEIFSQSEIKQIYDVIDEGITGLRDRAMLNIYYGCGLRSNEGIQLNVSDVLLEKGLLYVRKGKGYKERYVPFIATQKKDFGDYLKYGRPQLVKDRAAEESFLINNHSRRMNYNNALKILKTLQQRTENEAIQNKQIGLHTLRHSIATHLMQTGMQIENISTFLGHKRLSSTQIYTHIVNEIINAE
jgi:integrase/recombinase XerD